MRKLALLLLLLLTLAVDSFAQKTVHVREYRRKDGTVVRAHDRRAPGSSDSTPSQSQVEFREDRIEPAPLDRLSRLVLAEPYATVDLGQGSFYTPGGTGLARPRRVKR